MMHEAYDAADLGACPDSPGADQVSSSWCADYELDWTYVNRCDSARLCTLTIGRLRDLA